jgi:membrane fusion protein (multidrug efflux system)
MKLDFRIPEIYLVELKKGTVLEILVDALPGQVIKGEVSAISPSADFKAHNIEVRATVPNPDGTLRPGLFAKVSLIVDRQETILIPEQAIIPKDGQFFVMRVIEGNIVEMLPVKMGQRRPGLVQIHEGLSAGDTLIVAGQIKLFPGMPITPIFVDGSQQKPSDTQGE